MDLNWCPVCEQHIPLAWESSLYCSDRCKKADAMASHPALGYTYPPDLQTFPRQKTSTYSPLSSPTLTSVSSSAAAYSSPPTSPMTNYVYNKTSSGRISPPAFSLGHPADVESRRKSPAGPQYTMTTTMSTANKKGGFFW
ncbi:hypothetical protein BC939DRAFT_446376 [Gamsiella multidivaricata]|uniref:uncharacterized protein n=1 Tax=Gamsiella multidivaricata TaxID=101098 RepID=UPI00221F4874|nr:uncharacterized protein BC939DRAFT_446376 [Gamsiella multidivaricata]KAG0364759.1 hypothetical protein BGZ54_007184 [Gamsiella multidivaricata]KAI7826974.1 hypothetical protein BC939DRAFT_446376 [Gamsiella multidivaricata]